MNDDADFTVLTLPRGDRGEVRLSRCRFKGASFTKFQLWYPGHDEELRPGKQVITIRDRELGDVIAALVKIQRKVGEYDNVNNHNAVRRPTHTTRRTDDRQQSITTTGRTVSCDELDAGEVF